jgi:putative membrane protein insertion efficiency factor
VPHSSGLQNCKGGSLTPSVRLALAAIRGYQILIRPMLTGSCRYLPTCSEYAAEAVATHGVLRGGWMGLKRVLRCHPFGGSGLDPVR